MILYTVLILILVVVVSSFVIKEGFSSPAETVYTTNKLNFNNWLGRKYSIHNITGESLMDVYRHMQAKKTIPSNIIPTGQSSVMWISDPVDASMYMTSVNAQLIEKKDGYFVGIGLPSQMFELDCAYNLFNRTIGYLDRTDLHMIRAVLNGYRIPSTAVNIVEVPMADWSNLPKVLQNGIDLIITFVVPNSPMHSLIKSQSVSVVGWSNIDVDRVKVFFPLVEKVIVDVKGLFVGESRSSKALVMDKEKDGPLLRTSMSLYRLSKESKETFMTRLSISPEALDPSYRCYGDLSIEQKALCDSPYTTYGEPKEKPTTWDRPCVRDSDCPFFQANKNYANSRGGCLKGGICEMPVGVLRTAFQTYNDADVFAPFCYQCKDPLDPMCCDKQKDKNKYYDLQSPDYAFPNDHDARSKAGLPTFVSMN
jgi:predicted DNA-binding transcriptional regulator AlpA